MIVAKITQLTLRYVWPWPLPFDAICVGSLVMNYVAGKVNNIRFCTQGDIANEKTSRGIYTIIYWKSMYWRNWSTFVQ